MRPARLTTKRGGEAPGRPSSHAALRTLSGRGGQTSWQAEPQSQGSVRCVVGSLLFRYPLPSQSSSLKGGCAALFRRREKGSSSPVGERRWRARFGCLRHRSSPHRNGAVNVLYRVAKGEDGQERAARAAPGRAVYSPRLARVERGCRPACPPASAPPPRRLHVANRCGKAGWVEGQVARRSGRKVYIPLTQTTGNYDRSKTRIASTNGQANCCFMSLTRPQAKNSMRREHRTEKGRGGQWQHREERMEAGEGGKLAGA